MKYIAPIALILLVSAIPLTTGMAIGLLLQWEIMPGWAFYPSAIAAATFTTSLVYLLMQGRYVR